MDELRAKLQARGQMGGPHLKFFHGELFFFEQYVNLYIIKQFWHLTTTCFMALFKHPPPPPCQPHHWAYQWQQQCCYCISAIKSWTLWMRVRGWRLMGGLGGRRVCTLYGGSLVGDSPDWRQVWGALQGQEGRSTNIEGAPLQVFLMLNWFF